MSTEAVVTTSLEERTRPRFPTWLRGAALAVCVVQVLKLPELNALILVRAAERPGLTDGISAEMFRTAVYAGVGVLALFSAVLGCIVLYSTAKLLYRRAPDEALAFTGRNLAVLRCMAFSLVWPDLWSVVGPMQPLASPLFWLTHVAVVLLIARHRDHRAPAGHVGVCLGASLLGVLL